LLKFFEWRGRVHAEECADELNLKLQRELDENALLRQVLSKTQARFEEQGRRAPSIMLIQSKQIFPFHSRSTLL
jgi:hypothetical protein